MIISASYRTDIPAFYGQWFMNRLQAGYCKVVNPYSRKPARVSLRRADVDGFVFWTKNLAGFVKHFPEINREGFPFIILYSINGYPHGLERAVINVDRSVELFKQTAAEYGPRVCVWRYDPIVFSSLTDFDFHVRRFEWLAGELAGYTDKVIISFVNPYPKVIKKMNRAAKKFGFTWTDPQDDEKITLAKKMVAIASGHGLELSVCSQKKYVVPGSKAACCVDAGRLEDIGKVKIKAKLRPNREDCGCCESRDIGLYDTCPAGCTYCYATGYRSPAQQRYKQHDPNAEFLFEPKDLNSRQQTNRDDIQLKLFND